MVVIEHLIVQQDVAISYLYIYSFSYCETVFARAFRNIMLAWLTSSAVKVRETSCESNVLHDLNIGIDLDYLANI